MASPFTLNSPYFTGINGQALINTNDFTISGWSIRNPGTTLTFINSKSGYHPIRETTITDFTWDMTIDLDPTAQPFSSTYGVTPGYAITSAKLYVDKTGTPLGWSITAGIVEEILQSLVVAGRCSTTIRCAISGGTITPPGGTAY